MRISNSSVSVVIRSFGLAPVDGENTVIWLEIAPQHPKVVGAIWASLVNNTSDRLRIQTDEGKHITAAGLHRRYHRLPMDAPRLASRARPKFLRLVAPEACAITDRKAPFVALAWPGRTIGQSLAAMLEHGTAHPMLIGWGDYLLRAATAGEYAERLITGGPAPQGYLFDKDTPWRDFIAEGTKRGHLKLDGTTVEGDLLPLPEVKVESDLEMEDDPVALPQGEMDAEDEGDWKARAIAQGVSAMAAAFVHRHPGACAKVAGADKAMQKRIQRNVK